MFKRLSALIQSAKQHPYQMAAPWVALILIAGIEQTRLGEMFENTMVNLRFQARAPFDPPADPRLIFVGVDQQTIDAFGAWPWPRTVTADFLNTITNSNLQPKVVAFDLLFSDDFDKVHAFQFAPGASFDDALAKATEELPCTMITAALSRQNQNLGADQSDEKRTEEELEQPSETVPFSRINGGQSKIPGSDIALFPIRSLRKQSLFGFANDATSALDGIRRSIPLLFRVRDKVYPSLALQILCQTLSVDPDKVEVNLGSSIKLTDLSGKTWTIPIDEAGHYAINYRNNGTFQTLSFYRLFQKLNAFSANSPLPPECNIANKVLLVGQAADGLTDLGPSPYGGRRPLPLIHLDVINNVLKNDYLTFVPWPAVVAGWLLFTYATLFRIAVSPLVEAVLVPIAVGSAYVVVAFAMFAFWSIQIALAWPILGYAGVTFGAIVLRWQDELRSKKELRLTFSRMLSPEVINHILEHPANLKLGGAKRYVTILFSDIRDYTKFSEGVDEEELVRQLNDYFERMVTCVIQRQGTVHKFIGDAVMAAWGDIASVSLGKEEDARNAVRAALLMRRELRQLNEERVAQGLIPLRIGIGLNHGQVLVGQIGATIRSEFTVIGDSVNVASRLEGITKEFHNDLAIGESVRNFLGTGFITRRLGLVQLKGKKTPTVVYDVLAEKKDLSTLTMPEEAVDLYEKAFDHFLARRFKEAEAEFLACEKIQPGDYCVGRYLQACRDFIVNPPPDQWDGRIVMESK